MKVDGLQDPLLAQKFTFKAVDGAMVQILHSAGNHWLAVRPWQIMLKFLPIFLFFHSPIFSFIQPMFLFNVPIFLEYASQEIHFFAHMQLSDFE